MHLEATDDLRTLGLAETRVTDAGLEHLKAFGKLRVRLWSHSGDRRRPPALGRSGETGVVESRILGRNGRGAWNTSAV